MESKIKIINSDNLSTHLMDELNDFFKGFEYKIYIPTFTSNTKVPQVFTRRFGNGFKSIKLDIYTTSRNNENHKFTTTLGLLGTLSMAQKNELSSFKNLIKRLSKNVEKLLILEYEQVVEEWRKHPERLSYFKSLVSDLTQYYYKDLEVTDNFKFGNIFDPLLYLQEMIKCQNMQS